MSAEPAFARRGLLGAAVARVEAWLLKPAEGALEDAAALVRARPVIAVFGLGEGCGATGRPGAELAARDPAGACAVSCPSRSAAPPLGLPAAVCLADTLSALPGAWAQASGQGREGESLGRHVERVEKHGRAVPSGLPCPPATA